MSETTSKVSSIAATNKLAPLHRRGDAIHHFAGIKNDRLRRSGGHRSRKQRADQSMVHRMLACKHRNAILGEHRYRVNRTACHQAKSSGMQTVAATQVENNSTHTFVKRLLHERERVAIELIPSSFARDFKHFLPLSALREYVKGAIDDAGLHHPLSVIRLLQVGRVLSLHKVSEKEKARFSRSNTAQWAHSHRGNKRLLASRFASPELRRRSSR